MPACWHLLHYEAVERRRPFHRTSDRRERGATVAWRAGPRRSRCPWRRGRNGAQRSGGPRRGWQSSTGVSWEYVGSSTVPPNRVASGVQRGEPSETPWVHGQHQRPTSRAEGAPCGQDAHRAVGEWGKRWEGDWHCGAGHGHQNRHPCSGCERSRCLMDWWTLLRSSQRSQPRPSSLRSIR